MHVWKERPMHTTLNYALQTSVIWVISSIHSRLYRFRDESKHFCSPFLLSIVVTVRTFCSASASYEWWCTMIIVIYFHFVNDFIIFEHEHLANRGKIKHNPYIRYKTNINRRSSVFTAKNWIDFLLFSTLSNINKYSIESVWCIWICNCWINSIYIRTWYRVQTLNNRLSKWNTLRSLFLFLSLKFALLSQ